MMSEVAKTTALIEVANEKWDMALFYFSEALFKLSETNEHDSVRQGGMGGGREKERGFIPKKGVINLL